MNKTHFIAFAQEARHWREEARRWQRRTKHPHRATQEQICHLQALAIEQATINVGKRFDSKFREVAFRQACNPDLPLDF